MANWLPRELRDDFEADNYEAQAAQIIKGATERIKQATQTASDTVSGAVQGATSAVQTATGGIGDVVSGLVASWQDDEQQPQQPSAPTLAGSWEDPTTPKPVQTPSGTPAAMPTAPRRVLPSTGEELADPIITTGGEPLRAWARQEAKRLGIDPDIAERVAMSEGGFDNPVRQSNVINAQGEREQSYGPYQLYMTGGLGNAALQRGIDPRRPEHARAGVTFALEHARQNGWGAFHGAARVGIGQWDGIGQAPAQRPAMPTPPAQQQQAFAPPVVPLMTPNTGGRRRQTTGMVIHSTNGGAETNEDEYAGTLRHFANPGAEVSANAVIAADGTIAMLGDWDAVAWHAGENNADKFGVELVQTAKDNVRGVPFTDAQYRSLAWLTAELSRRYGFPIDRQAIVGHQEIEQGRRQGKIDPGAHFDWGRYQQEARGYAGQPAAQAAPSQAASAVAAPLPTGGYGAPPAGAGSPIEQMPRAGSQDDSQDMRRAPLSVGERLAQSWSEEPLPEDAAEGGLRVRAKYDAVPESGNLPQNNPNLPQNSPYDPDQGPREALPGSVGAQPLPQTQQNYPMRYEQPDTSGRMFGPEEPEDTIESRAGAWVRGTALPAVQSAAGAMFDPDRPARIVQEAAHRWGMRWEPRTSMPPEAPESTVDPNLPHGRAISNRWRAGWTVANASMIDAAAEHARMLGMPRAADAFEAWANDVLQREDRSVWTRRTRDALDGPFGVVESVVESAPSLLPTVLGAILAAGGVATGNPALAAAGTGVARAGLAAGGLSAFGSQARELRSEVAKGRMSQATANAVAIGAGLIEVATEKLFPGADQKLVKGMGQLAARRMLADLRKKGLVGAGKTIAREAGQEAVEEAVAESYGVAVDSVFKEKKPTLMQAARRIGAAAVTGAASGAAVTGAMQGVEAVADRAARRRVGEDVRAAGRETLRVAVEQAMTRGWIPTLRAIGDTTGGVPLPGMPERTRPQPKLDRYEIEDAARLIEDTPVTDPGRRAAGALALADRLGDTAKERIAPLAKALAEARTPLARRTANIDLQAAIDNEVDALPWATDEDAAPAEQDDESDTPFDIKAADLLADGKNERNLTNEEANAVAEGLRRRFPGRDVVVEPLGRSKTRSMVRMQDDSGAMRLVDNEKALILGFGAPSEATQQQEQVVERGRRLVRGQPFDVEVVKLGAETPAPAARATGIKAGDAAVYTTNGGKQQDVTVVSLRGKTGSGAMVRFANGREMAVPTDRLAPIAGAPAPAPASAPSYGPDDGPPVYGEKQPYPGVTQSIGRINETVASEAGGRALLDELDASIAGLGGLGEDVSKLKDERERLARGLRRKPDSRLLSGDIANVVKGVKQRAVEALREINGDVQESAPAAPSGGTLEAEDGERDGNVQPRRDRGGAGADDSRPLAPAPSEAADREPQERPRGGDQRGAGDAGAGQGVRRTTGVQQRGGDERGDAGDSPPVARSTAAPKATKQQAARRTTRARGRDHVFDAEDVATTGAMSRFDRNVQALRVLATIARENRLATAEEQQTLARYSGFGDSAFNFAFTGREPPSYEMAQRTRYNDLWSAVQDLGAVLKNEEGLPIGAEALTDSIKRSRLNAHYTTPAIIEAMWKGLERLGAGKLPGLRVLEPSAGSGRFLGLMPKKLVSKSQRTAVELDVFTGRILEQLFQNAEVHIAGFEKAPVLDNEYDIAISNVPFGNYAVTDKKYLNKKFLTGSIHNYFFAKALDKVRPGGVVAFVTSRYTMDSPSHRRVRQYLAQQADLLGAVRLPAGAFPDTKVVTDIIFLQKRAPGQPASGLGWVETQPISLPYKRDQWSKEETVDVQVNAYFADMPEMVLGTPVAGRGQYSDKEYVVTPDERMDVARRLNDALTAVLPADVMAPPAQDDRPRAAGENAMGAIEGSFVVKDGEVKQVKDGRLVPPYRSRPKLDKDGNTVKEQVGTRTVYVPNEGPKDVPIMRVVYETSPLSAAEVVRVRRALEVRDAVQAVLKTQRDRRSEAVREAARQELNRLYDKFVQEFGPFSGRSNTSILRPDQDVNLLRALEMPDPSLHERLANAEKNKRAAADIAAVKAPIFSRDVIGTQEAGGKAETPSDALLVALNEKGRLDFDRMGALIGKPAEDVRAALLADGTIYSDPEGGDVLAEEYLSGNVREKLAVAEAYAEDDPSYEPNVKALREVQPADVPPSQIDVRLGAPWVPEEDVNAFVKETLQVGYRSDGRFVYHPATGEWQQVGKIDADPAQATSAYGTPDKDAVEIIAGLLNGRQPVVTHKDSDGKSYKDADGTLKAQEKAERIEAAFRKWLWADPDRADRVSALYNEKFNSYRPRTYDGRHLTLPGKVPDRSEATPDGITLFPHQKNAVWRILQDGTAMLAHEVGTGKTFTMAAAAMELRRLGLSRKNVIVVPNHLVQQFANEFQQLYPTAKVLAPTERDFDQANRRQLTARIATGDWDAVVIARSQFTLIPVAPSTAMAFYREQISLLEQTITAMAEENPDPKKKTRSQKQLENAKAKLEAKLETERARLEGRQDAVLTWEELGVDTVFVDEADQYKNLYFSTKMDRVKGLSNTDSQRATDMAMKTRHLLRRSGGRGVVFATGTPISNTIAELWTMMRYLQPDTLESLGLHTFDAWAKSFGQTVTALEQTVDGGFRSVTRFSKFGNAPELSKLFQLTADIVMAEDVTDVKKRRPRLAKGKREVVSVPPSQHLLDYMEVIATRLDAIKNREVEPEEDNNLLVASDARKVALLPRLVMETAPEWDPDGKLAAVVRQVAEIHREEAERKGTQIVFLDLGTPKAKDTSDEAEDKAEASDKVDETETATERKQIASVYELLARQLTKAGVPRGEIAFVHQAKTKKELQALFARVNNGEIRVLIGSTEKMGAGTNVQRRLAALHHIDVPWRPRDVEQREGRIIRQGNRVYGPTLDAEGNVTDPGLGVRIVTYVTERSYDGVMWQTVEAKARGIKRMMRKEVSSRFIEDDDEMIGGAAEARALAAGNPQALEHIRLKNDVRKIEIAREDWLDTTTRARRRIPELTATIANEQQSIADDDAWIEHRDKSKREWKVGDKSFTEKQRNDANKAFIERIAQVVEDGRKRKDVAGRDYWGEWGATETIGRFNGFLVRAMWRENKFETPSMYAKFGLALPSKPDDVTLASQFGVTATQVQSWDILARLNNSLKGLETQRRASERRIESAERSLENYRQQSGETFEREREYQAKSLALSRLELELSGATDIPPLTDDQRDLLAWLNGQEEGQEQPTTQAEMVPTEVEDAPTDEDNQPDGAQEDEEARPETTQAQEPVAENEAETIAPVAEEEQADAEPDAEPAAVAEAAPEPEPAVPAAPAEPTPAPTAQTEQIVSALDALKAAILGEPAPTPVINPPVAEPSPTSNEITDDGAAQEPPTRKLPQTSRKAPENPPRTSEPPAATPPPLPPTEPPTAQAAPEPEPEPEQPSEDVRREQTESRLPVLAAMFEEVTPEAIGSFLPEDAPAGQAEAIFERLVDDGKVNEDGQVIEGEVILPGEPGGFEDGRSAEAQAAGAPPSEQENTPEWDAFKEKSEKEARNNPRGEPIEGTVVNARSKRAGQQQGQKRPRRGAAAANQQPPSGGTAKQLDASTAGTIRAGDRVRLEDGAEGIVRSQGRFKIRGKETLVFNVWLDDGTKRQVEFPATATGGSGAPPTPPPTTGDNPNAEHPDESGDAANAALGKQFRASMRRDSKRLSPGMLEAIRRAYVRAMTDDRIDLNMLVEEIEKEHGKLPAEFRVDLLARMSPGMAAKVNIDEGLKPHLKGMSEADLAWLDVFLTHMDNIDVAKAMGLKAEKESIDNAGPFRGKSWRKLQEERRRLAAFAPGGIAENPQKAAASAKRVKELERQVRRDEVRHQQKVMARAAKRRNRVESERLFSEGLTVADSQRALGAMARELGPKRLAKIQKAAVGVWEFNRSLLKAKLDNDVISQELYDELTRLYPHYVPTRIVDFIKDPEKDGGPAVGKSLSLNDTGLRRNTLEGTSRRRENPLASTYRNAIETERIIKQNQVALAMKLLIESDPDGLGEEFREAPEGHKLRDGEGYVAGFDKGKRFRYVTGEPMSRALKVVSVSPVHPMLRAFMNFWKELITRFPLFWAYQSIQDASTYEMREQARATGNPLSLGAALADLVVGYAISFRGILSGEYKGSAAEYLKSGGGMAGISMRNVDEAKERVYDLRRRNVLEIRGPGDVARLIRNGVLFDWSQAISERIEMAPRVASYRRAKRAGRSDVEATVAGRDVTLDFLRGGYLARYLNGLLGFFNVGAQASASIPRMWKENPRGFVIMASMWLAAGALIEAGMGGDDDEWEDLPKYLKDRGFLFPSGGTSTTEEGERRPRFFMLPMRELAPLLIPAREAVRRYQGKEGRDLLEVTLATLMAASPIQASGPADFFGNAFPEILATPAQLAMDYDWFRGGPVKTKRNDEQASTLAKGIANALQFIGDQNESLRGLGTITPAQVEFFGRGFGGHFARTVGAASDIGRDRGQQDRGPMDTPLVGGLVNRFVTDAGGERLRVAQQERNLIALDVRRELREAKVTVTIGTVRGTIEGVPLHRGEQARYQELANRYTDRELRALLRDGEFKSARGAERAKLVQQAIVRARTDARQRVIDRIPFGEQERRKRAAEMKAAG